MKIKKILINYANDAFKEAQKLNSKTGRSVGKFDKVIEYSPKDIDRMYRFLKKHLKGSSYGLFYTSASCEVLPEGVDKGTGMERLMALGGIDPSAALFIGDGQNDIPAARLILRGGGRVGAPANAVAALRRIASHVSRQESHRGALELLELYFPENDNIRRSHRPSR